MSNMWPKARKLALSGLLSIGVTQHAMACAFHGYTPDPTVVDILLGSEHVIVARLDASNPNRYDPIEALIGPAEIDIPLTVDQETRALLASAPAETALLARDGAYGPWLKLAVLDQRYREIIDIVIDHQSAWVLGGDEERFQVFANLVNDPNPDIRHLALQELDRADYSVLRSLSLPRMADLQHHLETGSEDLLPIRILLTGLSGDQGFALFLAEELEAAIQGDVPYLGAYATALIELEGAKAVRDIVDHHLLDEDVSVETREKVLEALAIQAQVGTRPIRRAIENGVADLLASAPEMAGAAARQFGFRSDWSVVGPVMRARAKHPPATIEDLFAVNQYIGLAQQSENDR